MKPESRKRLEDFVERADLIQTYSYFKNSENIVGFKLNKVGGQWQADFYQPDREQTASLLFDLRLFVQNKDDISIGRLEELCADPGISEKWKNEYRLIRSELNLRLDRLAAESPEGKITFHDVFRMVLFGALGHRSEKDRDYKLFNKWVKDENQWAITYNMFHDVVIWISVAVINIAKASKEELKASSNKVKSNHEAG